MTASSCRVAVVRRPRAPVGTAGLWALGSRRAVLDRALHRRSRVPKTAFQPREMDGGRAFVGRGTRAALRTRLSRAGLRRALRLRYWVRPGVARPLPRGGDRRLTANQRERRDELARRRRTAAGPSRPTFSCAARRSTFRCWSCTGPAIPDRCPRSKPCWPRYPAPSSCSWMASVTCHGLRRRCISAGSLATSPHEPSSPLRAIEAAAADGASAPARTSAPRTRARSACTSSPAGRRRHARPGCEASPTARAIWRRLALLQPR
jgi:hypothetical protein